MILVGQYDSPYVRRVAITLHHYGLAFARNPISTFTDVAEMARINPLLRIPSLVLNSGEVLIDSAAILDHLDEVAGPEVALVPPSGPARRAVLQIVAAATGAIDKAGATVYERHFHAPAAINAEWLQRCFDQLRGALTLLEKQLTGEWLALDRFTQADVTTAAMLGYLKQRVPDVALAREYPRLASLSERCERLPIFTAARPAANETMPG